MAFHLLTPSAIDLGNSSGSISHGLINDMSYLNLPSNISLYTANLYSKLKVFLHTMEWFVPEFSITHGIFQGDTMSPYHIPGGIQPSAKAGTKLKCPGFAFRIPSPDSEGLPDSDSTFLVLCGMHQTLRSP